MKFKWFSPQTHTTAKNILGFESHSRQRNSNNLNVKWNSFFTGMNFNLRHRIFYTIFGAQTQNTVSELSSDGVSDSTETNRHTDCHSVRHPLTLSHQFKMIMLILKSTNKINLIRDSEPDGPICKWQMAPLVGHHLRIPV